ncbi:hypothetical protein PSTT_10801, partial [Puccinia striiformis]
HWAQNLTPQDNHRIPVSALPAIPPQDETSPASEPDSGQPTHSQKLRIFQKLPCDCTRYSENYKDSRTITEHLGLDPEIESSICCPKCFRLYKHEDALTICAHHRSKKAQVCREGLFKTNANKLLPGYQAVPLIRQQHYPPLIKPFTSCLVYHTQPFNSWLKWFLNVAGIEDKIFAWREKVKSITDNRIADIQRVMHNWYNGVLQHHWRVQWASEPEPSKHLTHNNHLNDWEDDKLATFRQAFIFRTTHSQTFKQPCLTLSSLEVPLNLRDPKHRKLTASEWHSLFSTYLPLSLINFFVDNPAKCATGNNQNLLLNFLSLVICTNIVSLNSIYNSNSNKLVFDLQKIGPNHHYALHLPKR